MDVKDIHDCDFDKLFSRTSNNSIGHYPDFSTGTLDLERICTTNDLGYKDIGYSSALETHLLSKSASLINLAQLTIVPNTDLKILSHKS